MIPIFLSRVKTKDGITLDGLVVRPKRKTKTALIWLHGLSSKFYSGQTLISELAQRCRRNGIAYFKFNTRGHDIAARDGEKLIGGAFERFEDCVLDIRALIRYAKKLGCSTIFLAGHSTGANKALYYIYKTRDRSVKGLILLGPASDIAYDRKILGVKELSRRLAIARKLKKTRPLRLLPQQYGIWTTRRYVSILQPGKAEDVFPYYNPRARWKELKGVRVPMMVVFGSKDKYLDRPARELIRIFRDKALSTKHFSGAVIAGADHGFIKKEKELAGEIIKFVRRAIA